MKTHQQPKNIVDHLTVAILGLYPTIDRKFYHELLFLSQNLQEAAYNLDEHDFTQTGLLQFDFLDKPIILRANFSQEIKYIPDHLLPAVDGVIVHLPHQLYLNSNLSRPKVDLVRLKELVTIVLISKSAVIFTSAVPFNMTSEAQALSHRQTFDIPDSVSIIPYKISYQSGRQLLSQAVTEITKQLNR